MVRLLTAACRRWLLRRNWRLLWSNRSEYVRLLVLICRRTLWKRNFLALIFFKVFSVFPVAPHPHWPRRRRSSCDPVCKIGTRSYRSGYKRANLARRVTHKDRVEPLHKLVGGGGGNAGRSRCSDRAIQITIRGRNLTLTLNCLLNQRLHWATGDSP